MERNEKRISILREIISLSRPIGKMARDIISFPWDYDGNGVTLTAKDITNAINMYKNGEITSSDLENWADLIECREDIDYDEKSSEEINMAIFCLANPGLNGEISHDSVEQIRISLLKAEGNR